MSATEIAERLSQAVNNLNEDRVGEAEDILTSLITDHPDLPQAAMLMGTVRLRQNRFKEAEACFNLVLRDHPNQPTTLFHMGNALAAQKKLPAAMAAYRKAIAARRNYNEAQLALASVLKEAGNLEEAKSLYLAILECVPEAAEAILGLGDVFIRLEKFLEADIALANGERIRCDHSVAAEISERLGTSKMLQRRFAEALPHFERALALRPELTEAQRKRATVLDHLRQPQRAATAYREVLKKHPEDLKTHILLNELIHREGPESELLCSYDDAAKRAPASPIVPTARADQLMLLDRPEEAAEAYRHALRLDPSHLPAQIGLARAFAKLGDEGAAVAAFEAGSRSHPDDPSLKTAYAFHLLQQADAKGAQELAESAVRSAPVNQAALAVLGLCYRATNDGRDEDLNDYERFVRVFDLEPPAGYADMATFHRDLSAHLTQLPGQAGQYFSQTLRGGTRASEGIFEFREKTRDLLKLRIAEAVSRYSAEMPFRSGHAFLGRKESDAFRFSGSWSSRMKGGGFHVNHIHDGWISSVYYVDVPGAVADTQEHQGWLKFGEPSVDLALRDPIRRMVQPKLGRLVLFPSYMWHGTVPFRSDEIRTTIAFDATPA
ncbi:MAG TPA: tetratricopeptide repeat protein [Terriglobales bacterium]